MTKQWSSAAVALLFVALSSASAPRDVQAGVVNPDISVIGQPFLFLTNDASTSDRLRPQLDIGETEIVFDAYLNPYARGTVIAAIGSDGLSLEEGYFSLLRGLPLDLGLKGGQYRVGFGRINPVHPHVLPFAERFGVLAAYLPGDEALIEPGVSLSRRIPVHGDFSIEASADWLQGDSFRIERVSSGDPADPLVTGDDFAGDTRPAFAGRISGFTMLGEQSALEFGFSAVGGTNNVAAGTRTYDYGADVKAKLWTGPRSYLVMQGEALLLVRDDASWDPVTAAYTQDRIDAYGGYVFADYNWATRYNAGASFERYQRPSPTEAWDQSVGAFAGFSLMEETTAFRADWRRILPDGSSDYDEYRLRVIFSMGPHKAHQF
jgi:hypothetical protein